MTPTDALAALGSNPAKAALLATKHKIDRPYLGADEAVIEACVKDWRGALSVDDRVALASDLWDSNVHEGRMAAAKLLTQARIRPDDTAAWDLVVSWVPSFDAWFLADLAAVAGQKRLVSDPARLDTLESWTVSEHMWTRRAALMMTQPWTKQNHPKPEELAARDRVLGWAAAYVVDPNWHIQNAVAVWLRDLSKHDPARVDAFLAEFGEAMKPFARKEAASRLQ